MITTKFNNDLNEVVAPPSISNQGMVEKKNLLGFENSAREPTTFPFQGNSAIAYTDLKNFKKQKKLNTLEKNKKIYLPNAYTKPNTTYRSGNGKKEKKKKISNLTEPTDIIPIKGGHLYDPIKHDNMLLLLLRDLRPEFQPQLISYTFALNDRLHTRGGKQLSELCSSETSLPRQTMDTESLVDSILQEHDFYIKLIEDIGTFMYYFTNANSSADHLFAISTFLKLRISGSLISNLSAKIFLYYQTLFGDSHLQSFDDNFSKLRFYLDSYDSVKTLPIFLKLQKLLMYSLSLSLFTPLGITFSTLHYNDVEIALLKQKYHMGPDFLHCLCDSLLFLCERGYQAFKSGRLDPIFHSASSYETWFSQTKLVLEQSGQLNNPELHGFTEESYLGDLESLIEQGESIKRYATILNKFERKSISYYLGELKLAKANHMTLAKACSIRSCPFGILLFGDSGIGKSTIVDILYLQYAKYFNLPNGSEYRYPRHPSSKHWNNFRSQMWCLIYDELGFMNPDCKSQGEGSITEILQIMNYVPFCPEQAALEDKGKTPFLGRLVICTTNTKNFNASHYFSTPSAAQRRLPFVVTIEVRPEYSTDGQLDPTKTNQDPNGYPDYWIFKVDKVRTKSVLRPVAGQNGNADYVRIGLYDNINDFLEWYNKAIQAHHDNQSAVDRSLNLMRGIQFCTDCILPAVACKCDVGLQSHNMSCLDTLLTKSRCSSCGALNCPCSNENDVDICEICHRCCISAGCIYCECYDHCCVVCDNTESLVPYYYNGHIYMICDEAELQTQDTITPYHQYYAPSDPIRDQPQDFSQSRTQDNWFSSLFTTIKCEFKNFLIKIFACIVGWLISMNLSIRCPDWCSYFVVKSTTLFLLLLQLLARLVVGETIIRDAEWARASFRLSGYLTQYNYRTPKVLFGITLGVGLIYGLKKIFPRTASKPQTTDQEPEILFREPQEEGVVKPDVYHYNNEILQPFDYGRVIPSQSGMTLSEYSDMLSKNTGVMHIEHSGGSRFQRVTCVVGNIFILNSHAIRDIQGSFTVTVFMKRCSGVAECSYKMTVTQASFLFLAGTDLSALRITQSPPRKNILDLFYPTQFRSNRSVGVYLTKQIDGTMLTTQVDAIFEPATILSKDLGFEFQACQGETPGGLKIGDCGSLLIAFDGKMRCIVGLHTLGLYGNRKTFAQFINRKMVQELVDQFPVQVQCADPIMECSLRKVNLFNLHEKSVFRYIPDGSAQIFGSTDAVRGSLKSSVEKTIVCESLMKRGHVLNHTAPILNGYKIWRNAALDLLYPPSGFNNETLEICAKSFYADIRNLLPLGELRLLEPYTFDVSINGAAGVKFVDKIKRSTSAGFPRFQSKRWYLQDITSEDVNDQRVEPTDEIIKEYNILHDNALNGKRNHVIFVCTPKDEPITLEKAQNHKVRIFSGSPFAFTILMRMYFLSSCRVIMRNRFVFESMVGTIAQSSEWTDLYHYLTQFGDNQIAAGDFKKFDKTTLCSILYLSFKILIRLNMDGGNFCKKQERAMWSIAYDVIYAVYYFNGDLVTFMNGNPSGHVLTVIINCFVNSIYMRYVFITKHPRHLVEEFRANVALATYGDDNAMNIHSRVSTWFNHTTISEVLSDCGITYTMPDKTSDSIPLVHINSVDFLKRKWRYDSRLNNYVAPLDENSLYKSMMIWNRSKTISSQDQIMEIISSAVRESFFHGEVFYEEFTKLCREVIDENDLQLFVRQHTIPTQQTCMDDYLELSKELIPIPNKFLHLEEYVQTVYDLDIQDCSTGPVEEGPINQNPPANCSDCPLLIDLKLQSGEWTISGISPGRSPKSLFREIDKSGRNLSKIKNFGKNESSPNLNNRLAESTFNQNSDPLRSVGITDKTTEQVNLGIKDTNASGIVNQGSNLDDSFSTIHNPLVDLDSYLRRPVLINTVNWDTSTPPPTTPFYPWYLYFNNTAIKKKLDNYALMNCNLHIKVVISSTPFLFGNSRLTYRPLQQWCSNNIISTVTYDGDKVGYSQRPYIDISPQTNTGGELILPFFYPKDWLEIGEAHNLTAMGEMKFITFADLVSANGVSSESVTIQVFAWAENIKLAAPTVDLVMQSSDEYKDTGPVSGPASALANAMGSLSSVPIIGRYATATSMALSGVGSIAKAFGYTNVPNTTSANSFKNVPFSHITSPEISGPVEKLSLDPKNELAISSHIVGISEGDALSVESFVQRESWIYSTSWVDSDAVDSRLFSSRVTPQLLRVDGSSNYKYQMTPMSLLSNMFSYWRGDIIFKFKIICSKFHRGKLRVSWDPYGDINGTADSVTTVYNKIIDISQESEFEIRIPYKQATQWQNASATLQENFVGSDTLLRDATSDNGVLVVRVFTKQSAPQSSPITILVMARGAPDLEFAAPRDVARTLSLFPVQSADEDVGGVQIAQYETGKNSEAHPQRFLICQGESVKSLRQLLRRSCYNYTTANGGSGSTYMHQISEFILPRQPLFYGYDPNSTGVTTPGILVPGSNFTANFANNSAYHLIVPCFVGMRGSFNWHLNFDNDALSSTIIVERTKQASTTITVAANALAGASTHPQIDHFNWLRRSGMSGGAIVANQKTQTGMSVQAPMYSRFRMIPTSPYSMWTAVDGSESYLDKLRVKVILHPNAIDANVSADNSALQLYNCIGTDFNVYYFLNVPTFYSYTLPAP